MKNIFGSLGENLKHYLFSSNDLNPANNNQTGFNEFRNGESFYKESEPQVDVKYTLGKYEKNVSDRLNQLERNRFGLKLWSKDAEIFNQPVGSKAITGFMGWMTSPEEMKEFIQEINEFVAEVHGSGFKKVVLLGMGGSSLAPFLLQQAFENLREGLSLDVVDTTDPQTIEKVEYSCPLEHTLFIVASKSGGTAEVNALFDYFYAKVAEKKGEKAGSNFIAITDPGTSLVKLAKKNSFRKTFLNFVDIGGRYSALSYFGLVPAALIGVDIHEFLNRSVEMIRKCGPDIPVNKNTGIRLGATLGELSLHGRNKMTLLVPRKISSFTLWIEQLVAESTGKNGLGILPIEGYPIGDPEIYGDDRVFVAIHLKSEWDGLFQNEMRKIMLAGHPVIDIFMDDVYELSSQMYLWEIATATAGSVLQINPFDQPNVQENKDVTTGLLKELERSGYIAEEDFQTEEKNLKFFSGIKSAKPVQLLEKFFSQAHPGDFISIQAYLPENPKTTAALDDIRQFVEEWLCLAATTGYGPRFLHSTGQFHKGGPNKGLFIQITQDHSNDILIPGRNYSFGDLINAQALGDYKTLKDHGRRVIRIHLQGNLDESLSMLKQKIEQSQTEHLMNFNHTE